MALRSFPVTPTFQFTQMGKPLYLQNPNLFNLLFELWRRLGGEAETPDLTALETNVDTIFHLLNDMQLAFSELSDRVSQVEIDTNVRIDNTNTLLAAEDNRLYDLITDTQGAITDVSNQLADAEQDIQALDTLTATLASTENIEELLDIVDDMNRALTEISDQAFQATT